jgi:PAS domain-containing protein
LLVTIEESSFIDITLHDTQKQEFYTKMNLIGEITFEDHRGALITGYLPSELIRKSIFHLVFHDDRLVKLHALWKCKTVDKDLTPTDFVLRLLSGVTTGVSKLQWRMNARDGSLVFLQTEYKLILDSSNLEIIVSRNEVLR